MVNSARQRKKNIALSLSLVTLLGACVIAAMYADSAGSMKVDEGIFRVEDFASIDSIVMSGAGEAVAVHFDGSRWKVNDIYKADSRLVEVLFATLQQAIPRRPVAESLRDSIIQTIENNGIDVTLYSDGEAQKHFRVGANAAQSETWFMGAEGVPYVMTIPGYRFFVGGILSLNAAQWRDKYIFGFNASNFKQLDATFPAAARQGFSISMTDNGPAIAGMADADTTRLFDFLDNVARLTVDGYGKSHPDSIFYGRPAMEIVVTDVASRQYSVALFPAAPGSETFGGVVNASDTAYIDARKVDQVLKSRDFFRVPD